MFQRVIALARNTLRRYARARGLQPAFEQADVFVRHFLSLHLGKCQRLLTPAQVDAVEQILREATVDVDELTEFDLGIDLSIEKLNHLDNRTGAQVLGYAVPGSRRIAICERAERYLPLYRATVLHEVAHVLLHPHRAYRGAAYSPDSNRRPAIEREADAFMHATILPDSVLMLATVLLASRHGLDFAHLWRPGFARSVKGRWQWQRLILPGIVSRLCVSTELTAIKLQGLGVFDCDTVSFHKCRSLPNQWMNPSDRKPMLPMMRAFADSLRTRVPGP